MGPVLPVSLSYFHLGLPSLGAPGQEGTPLPRVREGGRGLGKTSTAGLARPVVEATVLAVLGVQGSSTKEWIVNLGYKLVNFSPSLGPSFLHSALCRHDPWPPPSPSPSGLPGWPVCPSTPASWEVHPGWPQPGPSPCPGLCLNPFTALPGGLGVLRVSPQPPGQGGDFPAALAKGGISGPGSVCRGVSSSLPIVSRPFLLQPPGPSEHTPTAAVPAMPLPVLASTTSQPPPTLWGTPMPVTQPGLVPSDSHIHTDGPQHPDLLASSHHSPPRQLPTSRVTP